MGCIVKRKGVEQKFDERKLYASVYSACLANHISHDKCESIADKVAKAVKKWIKDKKKTCVTSHMLFSQTVKELKKHNEKAAFLYETHRDIM